MPLSASATSHSGRVIGNVHFTKDNASLDAHDRTKLRAIAKDLVDATSITVIGYEQKTSLSKRSSSLGLQRAKAVKRYLLARGITARITIKDGKFPKRNATRATARRVEIRALFPAASPTANPSPSASITEQNVTVVNYFQTVCEEPDCSLQHMRFNFTSVTLTGPSYSRTQVLELQHGGQFTTVQELPSNAHSCEYRTVFRNVPNGTYLAMTSAALTDYGVAHSGWRNLWMTTESSAVIPESLQNSGHAPTFGPGSYFSSAGQSQIGCNLDESYSDIAGQHPVVGTSFTVHGASVQAPRIYANDDC